MTLVSQNYGTRYTLLRGLLYSAAIFTYPKSILLCLGKFGYIQSLKRDIQKRPEWDTKSDILVHIINSHLSACCSTTPDLAAKKLLK